MGKSKHKDHFGGRLIMRYYFILLLSSTIYCSTNVEIVQEDNVKIVQAGEDVKLTCTFSPHLQLSIAWFKQTADGKSLQIVFGTFFTPPIWCSNSMNMNNFNASKGDSYFNLTILRSKPSDSATYYCACSSYQAIGMGSGTRVLVRDAAADRHTTLQQSLIDTVHPGASVNLQCSIFTESCAEDHNIYWFKQSSGDSEGVLYSKAERNGHCKKSTESQRQSCVYSLHKSNISHSDTGIYYCAVAACGEILFGRGTELIITESDVNPTVLGLVISNIIFLALVVFLGIKLFRGQNKTQGSNNEDSMNYAAIAFTQISPNTRRTKSKVAREQSQSLYAQARSHQ